MTTNKEAKTLYFEGAGMDFEPHEFSDIGNYRIRTAFTNLDGEKFYLEMGRSYRHAEKKKDRYDWALHIDFLFNLKYEDGSNNQIQRNHLEIAKLDYRKESITKWINENLNCDFETIQVIDFFYGYRVHASHGEYTLMETIDLNHKRAIKRKEAYNAIDTEYRTLLNEKYSKIGLLEMDDEGITIRCHASDEALGDIPRVKRIPIV